MVDADGYFGASFESYLAEASVSFEDAGSYLAPCGVVDRVVPLHGCGFYARGFPSRSPLARSRCSLARNADVRVLDGQNAPGLLPSDYRSDHTSPHPRLSAWDYPGSLTA